MSEGRLFKTLGGELRQSFPVAKVTAAIIADAQGLHIAGRVNLDTPSGRIHFARPVVFTEADGIAPTFRIAAHAALRSERGAEQG